MLLPLLLLVPACTGNTNPGVGPAAAAAAATSCSCSSGASCSSVSLKLAGKPAALADSTAPDAALAVPLGCVSAAAAAADEADAAHTPLALLSMPTSSCCSSLKPDSSSCQGRHHCAASAAVSVPLLPPDLIPATAPAGLAPCAVDTWPWSAVSGLPTGCCCVCGCGCAALLLLAAAGLGPAVNWKLSGSCAAALLLLLLASRSLAWRLAMSRGLLPLGGVPNRLPHGGVPTIASGNTPACCGRSTNGGAAVVVLLTGSVPAAAAAAAGARAGTWYPVLLLLLLALLLALLLLLRPACAAVPLPPAAEPATLLRWPEPRSGPSAPATLLGKPLSMAARGSRCGLLPVPPPRAGCCGRCCCCCGRIVMLPSMPWKGGGALVPPPGTNMGSGALLRPEWCMLARAAGMGMLSSIWPPAAPSSPGMNCRLAIGKAAWCSSSSGAGPSACSCGSSPSGTCQILLLRLRPSIMLLLLLLPLLPL